MVVEIIVYVKAIDITGIDEKLYNCVSAFVHTTSGAIQQIPFFTFTLKNSECIDSPCHPWYNSSMEDTQGANMNKQMALIALAALIAGYAMGQVAMPQCEEDAVVIGTGDFEHGRWTSYECGPSVDDYSPDAGYPEGSKLGYPTLYHACDNGICITSLTQLD